MMVGRRSRQREVVMDGEGDQLSRDIVVRRQDQKLIDDITNKLYRIEMDRIKPSSDVQYATASFRASLPYRRRQAFTPEPTQEIVRVTRDPRRYSTAGNLDIYRPRKLKQNDFGFERPEPTAYEYNRSVTTPLPIGWKSYSHETTDPLSEYELRKLAEVTVRARDVPNGPTIRREITYLPLVQRQRESYTPERYRDHVTVRAAPRVSSAGKKVSDGQYEIDQFEKLMNRTFGSGGVNRQKTLLYSAPLPKEAYEYTSLPPYVYSSPYASSAYYSRGMYPRHTSYPSYYTQPYYVSSYAPYSYNYSSQYYPSYDYLQSPPTRVTPPWHYGSYYGSGYGRYGGYPGYSTYTYSY